MSTAAQRERWDEMERQSSPIQWDVIVHVEGREDTLYRVHASREGLAETHAIRHYTDDHHLSGEFVSYTVQRIEG